MRTKTEVMSDLITHGGDYRNVTIVEVLLDIRDQLAEANKIDGNKIYLLETPVTKTTVVNYEVDIKRIFEDGTTAHLESIEFESTGKLMTRSEILTVALSKIS